MPSTMDLAPPARGGDSPIRIPRPNVKSPFFRILLAAAAGLGPWAHSIAAEGTHSLAAEEQPPRKLDFFVGAGALYDDNLFRQPSGADLSAVAANLHRDDLIERLTAGVDGTWTLARQTFELQAHGDGNRFEHNDQLNNVSGKAMGSWDWRLGSRLSGRLGADYARSLADFANNLVLVKDVLTQKSSFASGSYLLGNRWTLTADIRWASIDHGAEIRQVDDANIRTQKLGIAFRLLPSTSVGWNYRHANANFAGEQLAPVTGAFDRNYDESASVFWLNYALGSKTDFNLEGGYLRRNYPNAAIGNYSGGTGRATLTWRPGAKTQLVVTGWRDLTAYIDAESNYFVSTGARIAPTWTPTERISTSLAASWERQKYIGSELIDLGEPFRRDTVRSVQAGATYLPRDPLQLDLTLRHEQRGSNRSALTYKDNLAILGVRFTF
ncbi:MAG: outer membrane beta-barrel protein [Proteobacteria bacterium]|nr:outer membrane beta-barrel protein [Pseudomonadota bacterium]